MRKIFSFWLILLIVLSLSAVSFATTASLKVTNVNGAPYSGQSMYSGDILSIVGQTDFPVLQIQVWGLSDNGDPRLSGHNALGSVSNGWLISGWEEFARGPDFPNTDGWLYAPGPWLSLTGNDVTPFDKQGNLWGFDYTIPVLPSFSTLTIEAFNLTPSSGFSGAWSGPGEENYFQWEPLKLSITGYPLN